MPGHDRKQLIDEAADIFVRLREDPNNPDILAQRHAFLERWSEEKEVYSQVAKAWAGVGRKPGVNKPLVIAFLAGLIAASYFGFEPVRNHLLADFATRLEPLEARLTSGDIATLDAATALADGSDGAERRVTLFEGAALFDVTRDGRVFEVVAGDVIVEVLGTVFETVRAKDMITVSVGEGRVRVTAAADVWTLEAGDRLIWSQNDGGRVGDFDPETVALWRQDRFVADGLTLEHVARVIDRRLGGRVFVRGAKLAQSRVSGTIDLENPERALAALAASRGARLISVPPLGYVILP